MDELTTQAHLDAPPDEVFAWHGREGAFERLIPPWERVRIRDRRGTLKDGDYVVFDVRVGPIWRRWVAVCTDSIENQQFVDDQLLGPFAIYRHTHRFAPEGDGCRLEDRVEYALPFPPLGRALAGRSVRHRLTRLFGYRHRVLAGDLEAARGTPPLTVAVSGSSGLIGRALCAFLAASGVRVRRLLRSWPAGPDDLFWDPERNTIAAGALDGVDAVIHLAGESLAGRWTAAHKERIRQSRVAGTHLLAEALAGLPHPPRVLVSASAVGIYGACGEQPVDEDDALGSGFLAEVCKEWEAATEPARRASIRVVNARLGTVLSPAGGALAHLLPPFRLGLGGPIGDGRQGMSFIALDDALYALHRAITDQRLSGPVNLVAPEPLSQREFAATLGSVLGRPAILPLPASAVRLLLGELGESLLLQGARVRPRKLQAIGFRFRYPTLEAALRHELGRPAPVRASLEGRTPELLPQRRSD